MSLIVSNVFNKLSKYLLIALLISTTLLYAQTRSLKADNLILKNNVTTLKDSVATQSLTIESLQKDREALSNSVQSLVKGHSEISHSLFQSLDELSKLRATEAKNAIEHPFERGNSASERINNILLSIGTPEDTSRN